MNDEAKEMLIARVLRCVPTELQLRCQQDAAGVVGLPSGAVFQLNMKFSVPELRSMGIDVQILDANNHAMTDDEYAALLLSESRPSVMLA